MVITFNDPTIDRIYTFAPTFGKVEPEVFGYR